MPEEMKLLGRERHKVFVEWHAKLLQRHNSFHHFTIAKPI